MARSPRTNPLRLRANNGVPDVGNDALTLRPVEIGGFKLGSHGATPVGRPTSDGWQQAFYFACAVEQASPYWVGDLLAYAEDREDWRAKFDQMVSVTRHAAQTLFNKTYVSRHVAVEQRRIAPTPGHSAEVAKIKRPAEQTKWLSKAREENLTVRELRDEIRAAARTRIIDSQATLAGMFRVIYADPPWLYGDRGATVDGSLGKAERHYPGMTIDELCKLPVEAHTLENAVLFMWITAPMLYENPGPREVIEAWGFKPKTGIVWDKVLGNYGHYVHGRHEHLIIATRGSCMPDAPVPSPDSVLTVRRDYEHSAKPEDARKIITQLYTRGPYLELFGRQRVEGWDVFGNDARLWGQEQLA